MLSLFMINKHGCLIYYKCLNGNDTLSSNDIIRLASTLHGLSTISLKLCIPKSSDTHTVLPKPKGITYIESDVFRLQCLESLTGLCIFIVCDTNRPSKSHVNIILNYIYELYSDFVQKCPFHQLDMPIRSKLFEEQIALYFKDWS
ncbi:sybindin-like family domain-containing protein [Theileria equi strain WA]|uniref:Trafficking protein particle complex subunit n=1 Tax=Theileria equi strain WA TaxID=1537102 RepID=L0B0J5_THEEQ|nr:sybindin-like family domain-containing protein [Theileria equi strain WA]AFZ81335.1 sybindin-like family domain-containing protein [Theileria equi strain WA]|eukprot:XP_004831001.1 sybindin-like family domain-containing protein [Theileria equi strain WA]